MSHLEINTIIDYVMINEFSDEAKALASMVCGHIKECEECRNLVNAYQNVYDALIEEASNLETIGENLRNITQVQAESYELEY